MTQPTFLELAKQGDAEAIAFLINRHLQPKGITAKATLENTCLQIILESMQVPNQRVLVAFIHKGLTGLGATSIEKVKIYAQQTGQEFQAWSQEFDLDVDAELQDKQPDSEAHNLTISINLNGHNVQGLTDQNFEIIANKITNDIFSSCTDVFIQKVSISNGSSVITKER